MKKITSVIVLSCVYFLKTFGQEGVTYDIKKPAKYETRILGYEKTYTTKFKVPRRFIQNTITHYNYYFNANNKLNEVVARAKAAFRDDFTRLLPFYGYSFETLHADKRNLDSVIGKVNNAILVRDLRNDWVDNLYLLMGQAYYYESNFDSAYTIFQFVDYAFAPRDNEGDLLPVGSNFGQEEGAPAMSVSTSEKRNLIKRTFSRPPSRNEALVWLARNWITSGSPEKATALIELLRNDPQFPHRLNLPLQETEAYLAYMRGQWDSTTAHLAIVAEKAADQKDRARWEYLIAQLYERTGRADLARDYYEKSAGHTLDPVMDVYARLNAIRMNRGNGRQDYIRKNIAALLRMSRKDIYLPYLDIIYYAAGEMEMERGDRAAARTYFRRASVAVQPGGVTRNRAFMKLGWLGMSDKEYVQARSAYDSLDMNDRGIADSTATINDRKKALARIVPQIRTIRRQDSLQAIAAMTPAEREAYIRKMIRAIRRQRGLAEEETASGNGAFQQNQANQDLFGSGSGDWYFNNSSVKAKGFSDFRTKWGNRPNVDNWMLQSLVTRQRVSQPAAGMSDNGTAAGNAAAPAITAEALLADVPLTPEKLQKSRDSVEKAYFLLGKGLQEGIPDYGSAIVAYDSLLTRFPVTHYYQEALFNEYYCYTRLGDSSNAARILAVLRQRYPTGNYLALIDHPSGSKAELARADSATTAYQDIYVNLIEGNYDTAISRKQAADSVYGEKYWTPQLLFVKAIYEMHTRKDSAAKVSLGTIIRKYSGTPIADRAKEAFAVLTKRRDIEHYLENLEIKRATDSETVHFDDRQPVFYAPRTDTARIARPKAKTDSALAAKPKAKTDTASAIKPASATFRSAFATDFDKPYFAALVFTKVDPVFVTESRNAFDRFNQENYYGKSFEVNKESLSDTVKLVTIGSFASATEALDYEQKTSKRAGREVIPWLPATKYTWIIISQPNLELLKSNKDVPGYQLFLRNYFPGRF